MRIGANSLALRRKMCGVALAVRNRVAAKRALRKAWRLQRAGDLRALERLEDIYGGTRYQLIFLAMRARAMAEEDELPQARALFNMLYGATRGSQDPINHHLRLFALYNLSLIRNSIDDAAHFSRKARDLKSAAWLRGYVPVPLIVVQPRPGTAVSMCT